MLANESLDYRQITKELDYNYCYSSTDRLAIVRVLCDIRNKNRKAPFATHDFERVFHFDAHDDSITASPLYVT